MDKKTRVLNIMAEDATSELLSKMLVFKESAPQSVEEALELSSEHLRQQKEIVDIKKLGEKKYKVEISCNFAEHVHPAITVDVCLWTRYLLAIVRSALKDNEAIEILKSVCDQEGSTTVFEIVRRSVEIVE